MATLTQAFNAAEVEPQQEFSVLQPGWYPAMATDSQLMDTKSGNGQYLKFTFQVIDGPAVGRRVFWNANIVNPNPEAERIGKAQLSAFCHAAKVLHLTDSAQLHSIPVKIKVTIREASGSYGAQNEVKGFEAIDGASTGVVTSAAPAPSAPKAASAPAAAKPAMPWQKTAA